MSLRTLERTLRHATRDGTRDALLLLGNGVNIQAALETGIRDPDPWLVSLRRVAREFGVRDVSALPPSDPLRWDALVREAAAHRRLRPAHAHAQLRAAFVRHLTSFERKRRTLPLFGRILDCRFENIVSFNIDRTLPLYARGRVELVKETWTTYTEFQRHSVVRHDGEAVTRVWQPYGDTTHIPRVLLGTAHHSERLMFFEDQRAYMMNDWVGSRVASWSYPGAAAHTTLKSPAAFYAQCRQQPSTWYRLIFTAPLVIVGAGLPVEDWPLWWLLHQRARNLAVFRTTDVPPAFVLTVKGGGTHPHLVGRPSEIELIEFASHDALWQFVLR